MMRVFLVGVLCGFMLAVAALLVSIERGGAVYRNATADIIGASTYATNANSSPVITYTAPVTDSGATTGQTLGLRGTQIGEVVIVWPW